MSSIDGRIEMRPCEADASPTKKSERSSCADSADAAVLAQVYRAEGPRLARYFRARLRPGEEPCDLVQEAFVRLAGLAVSTLPRPAAYLQRIARNLLYDRAKRLETRLAPFHLPIGEGTEPSVPAEQDHMIEADDVMRLYRCALDELPERTREIFMLHRLDDLTYKEIGTRLGISIPTVQYHFARALAHIDAALRQG